MIKIILPKVLLDFFRKFKYGTDAIMEMYGIKKEEVIKLFERPDIKIIDIAPDQSPGEDWESYRYCVIKKSPKK